MTVMVILFVIVFALIAFVVSYYLTKDLRKLTGAVERLVMTAWNCRYLLNVGMR